MPIKIRIRILPHDLHKLERPNLFFTFIHNISSLHCLIFLVSVIGVINFNILDIILKFSGKKYSYLNFWLKLIRVRIRQKVADLTESGSTTLVEITLSARY